ncbi:MAG: 2TM domain-containing protein [Promethearchaeota archaeon]
MLGKINNLKNDLKMKSSEIKSSVKDMHSRKDNLRIFAERKVNLKNSLKVHLVIFIFGNILLFIINLLFTPQNLWAFESLLGWSIGYLLHIIAYWLYSRPKAITGETDILFHLIIYLIVNTYLLYQNLITETFLWVIYPIVFWGFGFLVHALIYYIFYRDVISTKTGEKISKIDREIEKEIEKMKGSVEYNVVE